jgi:hypothetical protein
LVGLLAALSTTGCGGASQRESSSPGAASGATGTLVVRVAGHPRDIRYFINGKHFQPDYEIEWWRDARLEVELEPGSYQVDAEYLVRAFAGDGETYRITTPEPVEVRTGEVTLLYARIDKDYRGVPTRQTEEFSVLHPTRSPQPEDEPAAEPRGQGEAARGDAPVPTAPDVIRIQNENVRVDAAQHWTSTAIVGNSIQVRGSNVTASSGAAAPTAVERDEHTTITIRLSSVSQSFRPETAADVSEEEATAEEAAAENLRIRAGIVERAVAPPAPLVDPDGGNAFRIRGSQVHQDVAPARGAATDASAPPQAIDIRGERVTRSAAPPAAEPPGAEAPGESIRIRGTQVDHTVAPAASGSPAR